MSLPSAALFDLDFFGPLPIRIEVSDAPLTSDAGLLPLRQCDDRIGLTARFAAARNDPRDPARIDHSVLDMVRMRVFGILAGYEDQTDPDTPRADPVVQRIANRSPNDADLASQPTLSRFENQIDIASLKKLRAGLIDELIAAFAEPPLTLTFDLDAVDDPTPGAPQRTLFHGYSEQYQYLPLVVTCAEADEIVRLSLRHGTAAASLGADDDLAYLVSRVRAAWPGVRIRVRGDCGFGVPILHDPCARRDVLYPFGQSANAVLQRHPAESLADAVRRWDQTHEPQRLFAGFRYQAQTRSAPRWVVAKAEANAQGTKRRFGTTNRPGATLFLGATYDEYAMRGESENRNKEFKGGRAMDRLSDHRFLATFVRLYRHAAALTRLARLRREIADPPPAPVVGVPVAAWPEPEPKRYQNARRRRDPLGAGQPATWRLRMVKVAASVVVSCRRIVIRLSGSWPNQQCFESVRQHVCRRPAVAHFWTG